jgi:hypothetical protein
MPKRQKKLSLKTAAEKLASIAEKHLASLPEAEQDARVKAFARRTFKKRRGAGTRSSENGDTRVYPVAARGRE